MIRKATFADIPRLVEVLQDGYQRSIYAGRGEIDPREARTLFQHGIQRHGSPMAGGTQVNVAETDGRVEGFHFGMLDRVMHVGTVLTATDVWFVGTARMEATDAFRLLLAFVLWAEANPKVIEIRPADSGAIGDPQDPRKVEIYRRAGLVPVGMIYERRPAR